MAGCVAALGCALGVVFGWYCGFRMEWRDGMGWGCSRSLNFHTWSMPFYTHVTRAVTHGGCFGKDWVGVGWGGDVQVP